MKDGKIRRTQSTAQAPDSLAKSKSLSIKAKGLYLMIAAFSSGQGGGITKERLKEISQETDESFENSWNELKEAGYIRVYLYPDGSEEYEALLKPVKNTSTVLFGKESQAKGFRKSSQQNKEGYLEFNGDIRKTPFRGASAPKQIAESPLAKISRMDKEQLRSFIRNKAGQKPSTAVFWEYAVNAFSDVTLKAIKGSTLRLHGDAVDNKAIMSGIRHVFADYDCEEVVSERIGEISNKLSMAVSGGGVRNIERYAESIAITVLI